jgi:thiamine-monophosphate kinase
MSLGEFELIARYFAAHDARSDVLLGIGDDAAVLACSPERRLVVAMDSIVEGIHFLSDADPYDIGYRALAVNLSDIAAMGAIPSWMTLSLSLPNAQESWLERFSAGLLELARAHDVALIGGDTVKGPLVVTVQIGGWVETDRWLTRSGACPGDAIFVSGTPGEAAAGLQLLKTRTPRSDVVDFLRDRFLRPAPRIALGRQLRLLASAAMDVSDGLLTDLDKLCAASHCAAQLALESLPASAPMHQLFDHASCVDYALAGGDDYEILFTVPAEAEHLIADLSVPCTRIGVITPGKGVECLLNGQTVQIARRGFDHFPRGATL